jgi:hypothetical protein
LPFYHPINDLPLPSPNLGLRFFIKSGILGVLICGLGEEKDLCLKCDCFSDLPKDDFLKELC